jgi:hypothetical protein
MERVAFLIESTGERIGCLLNPNTLVVRRSAGISQRRAAGSHLTGVGLTDDPLLFTGGGRTELDLELLFDVSLAGPDNPADDVRQLTTPLWQLAENRASGPAADSLRRPPLVRFVWGKSWNVPGVVAAISERLEQFDGSGLAQRSWLTMRLLRVEEPPAADTAERAPQPPPELPSPSAAPEADVQVHQVLGTGAGPGEPQQSESLYEVAFRYYGNPGMWRLIAAYNGIADPLRVPAGTVLRIPAQGPPTA